MHNIVITWTAALSAVKYFVYRGLTAGGESGTPINSTPVTGTSYTDAAVVAGTKYYYFVTSMDANGNQSVPSSEVSATVPNPLLPPTNITATAS